MRLRGSGIDLSVKNQVYYDPTEIEYPTEGGLKNEHDYVIFKSHSGKKLDKTRVGYIPSRTFFDLYEDYQVLTKKPILGFYNWVTPWDTGRDQANAIVRDIKSIDPRLKEFSFFWTDVENSRYSKMSKYWGEIAEYVHFEVEQQLGIPGFPYTRPSIYNFLWQEKVRWMKDLEMAWAQYVFKRGTPEYKWRRIFEAETDWAAWKPAQSPYHEGGWAFWQLSADENKAFKFGYKMGVKSTGVDFSYYNGTNADLQKRFKGTEIAEAPVPEPDITTINLKAGESVIVKAE